MNSLFFISLLTLSLLLTPTSTSMVSDIALGLLEAVGKDIAGDDLETCLDQAQAGVGDMGGAIDQLSSGDKSGIKNGLEDLATSLINLFQATESCPKIYSHVVDVISQLKSLADPVTLAIHVGEDILYNGVDIYNNVQGAISDYQSQNWFAFGGDIGDILSELMFHVPYQNVEEPNEFVEY